MDKINFDVTPLWQARYRFAKDGPLLDDGAPHFWSSEQGRYIPSLPLALKYAQIFNCGTDELLKLNAPQLLPQL